MHCSRQHLMCSMCMCNLTVRNKPWVPAAASWLLPAGAAGPFAACRPSVVPAHSAQQTAHPLQVVPLMQVPQAMQVACTSDKILRS